MRDRPPTCVGCGYELTGVGAGEDWGVCPECGLGFDPQRPYPRRWPHPAMLMMVLTGPITLIVVGAAGLLWAAQVLPHRLAGLAALSGSVLLVAIFVTPVYIGWRIACVHAVKYERLLVWVVLSALCEIYAIGLTLVVAFMMARLSA